MSFRPRGGRTVIVLPDGSRGVVRREFALGRELHRHELTIARTGHARLGLIGHQEKPTACRATFVLVNPPRPGGRLLCQYR